MPIIIDYSGGGKKRIVRAITFLLMQILCTWGMISFNTLQHWETESMEWRIHGLFIFFFIFSFVNMIRELWLYFKEKQNNV